MRSFFLFCLILIPAAALAQFYDSGQDPASYKWRQLDSPHFKVIYPDTAEALAQKTLQALEASREAVSYSLGVNPRKIAVVLHPGSVVSNAYVGYAPRRIEMVTTPPQDNDGQDWIEQLALHEYRHVVQFKAVDRKFSRVLYWIFGEQITAGIMGTFVPFWFIEGDATLTETLLSEAGRGRLPSFDADLRAGLLENGPFSYDKAVFGSYRDFVPDHYVLGYHILTMARRTYGSKIGDTALNRVAGCPVMITPFNNGIRRSGAGSKVKLYKSAMSQLDSIWRSERDQTTHKPVTVMSPGEKHYCRYEFPAMLENGSIITMKSGVDDIRRIVRINTDGSVDKITVPGYYSQFSLSAAGNSIVWAELAYDPRWENRNYSVIYRYDLEKRKKIKLSSRSRLAAPALSPDASEIVAVETDLQNQCRLVILDAENGKRLLEMPFPDGQIISPAWSEDGKQIVFVALCGEGKQLMMTNRFLQQARPLFPPVRAEISHPGMFKDLVFFSSSLSGVDNIYVYDIGDSTARQVSSVKYGAYHPDISPDHNTLLFTEVTARGRRVVSMVLDSSSWIPVDMGAHGPKRLFEGLETQEKGIVSFPDSVVQLKSKPYRKFVHLLNPHSWGPISVDPNAATVKPGLTLSSQNKLATLISTLGWEYSLQEGTGKYYANVSFRQWYPIIDLRFEYGPRKSSWTDTSGNQFHASWKETAFRAAIRIPLNLSSGKWVRWLQPSCATSYYFIGDMNDYPQDAFRGYFRSMDYSLFWESKVISGLKDIYPRWGQLLILNYRHTPFSGANLGSVAAVRTKLFFPGIGKHHNLQFAWSWQHRDPAQYMFSDLITHPRSFSELLHRNYHVLAADYTLPLAYPDWHAGSVVYLKRLYMSAWMDHAWGYGDGNNATYTACGLDLYADLHIFRFLAPFALGGRLAYNMNEKRLVPEFLYSLNLDGIQ